MSMALEDARKFVKMVVEDKELCGRLANMSIEEGLSAAKDMGLDFTIEELTEARDTCELSLDEMDQVSGGDAGSVIMSALTGAIGGGAPAGIVGLLLGGPIGGVIGAAIGGVAGGVYAGVEYSNPE